MDATKIGKLKSYLFKQQNKVYNNNKMVRIQNVSKWYA